MIIRIALSRLVSLNGTVQHVLVNFRTGPQLVSIDHNQKDGGCTFGNRLKSECTSFEGQA